MKRRRPFDEIPTLSGHGKTRRPNTRLYRVPIQIGDRHVDFVEAAETFAEKPWAHDARYIGASRGLHVFEIPAEAKT